MRIYSRLLMNVHAKYYSQMEGGNSEKDLEITSSIKKNTHTVAEGIASHAEGASTIAEGIASHAEGSSAIAKGIASHAEGGNTVAYADYSHVEGANSIAKGIASHAEGNSNVACGNNSHAEGSHTTTGSADNPVVGGSAHAEGSCTIAYGNASHAEGDSTTAYGNASHVEGRNTTAGDSKESLQGLSAHAEGYFTTAYGDNSHAEGEFTFAQGDNSHAEGLYTIAKGNASHTEGAHTSAEGEFSHAEGVNTQAIGDFSHTEGIGTCSKFKGSHVMGKYGDAEEHYSWFIGNGLKWHNREIGAKWLASNRNMYIDGSTYIAGGTNYAEMFEVQHGTIDVGFFVTLDGEYVRKATDQDEYILGITSVTSSVLGNSAEMRWSKKYLLDEWGRIQHDDQIYSKTLEKQAILNPDWDNSKEYISRINRPEWISVGLLGQIRVRDDGTCKIGGYCMANTDGIATESEKGYKVIKRINNHQVIIMFK